MLTTPSAANVVAMVTSLYPRGIPLASAGSLVLLARFAG